MGNKIPMPWKETGPMLERVRFVGAARRGELTMAELCAVFGISRKTGYKWLERFEQHGVEGLHEQSRRPVSNSRAVPDELVERLVKARQAHL
jgi:transposase